MNLAIGSLHDAKTGRRLGTAFAVGDRHALTAFHCIGSRERAKVENAKVKCKWAVGESAAVVVGGDTFNDIALLRFDKTLPLDLAPVELITDVAIHERFIAPGAPVLVRDVFNFAASGEITWRDAILEDGSTAIQLACFEAQDLALGGLSGAPVLVGHPPRAVGIVRRYSPRDDEPLLANGGSLFAAPVREALTRWKQIDPRPAKIKHYFEDLTRQRGRAEPLEVRHALRQLLALADLGLAEEHIHNVEGGSSSSCLLKIDLNHESVATCITQSLERPEETRAAEGVLVDYMRKRAGSDPEARVALLTDGLSWKVYRHSSHILQAIDGATLVLDPLRDRPRALFSWLEALLATSTGLTPTPRNICEKLGAESPAYFLHFDELRQLYDGQRDHPTTQVKRDVWAKLLTTASGINFANDDDLFVNHTLLVVMAEIIGHIALGFSIDLLERDVESITSGELFAHAQIGNVVESDFFDWVKEAPEGILFIRDLARRLARFDWDAVEHDVLKALYESIIPQSIRRRLGEYYTPDWLAESIVEDCVSSPLTERVVDASCGSGTFIFHSVRAYIGAAEASGMDDASIVSNVRRHVLGFDVHPVAVTLARVTYLLAIGVERIRRADRPAFSVPVYLADSLRWGEEKTLWSDGDIRIPASLDHETFVSDPNLRQSTPSEPLLRFPENVLDNVDDFDSLVSALAERAVSPARRGRSRSLAALWSKFGIDDPGDRSVLADTFAVMCRLHDENRDHIWGYYVRNVVRPAWLSRPENRADVLVGNPPWLSYRFMTKLQQLSFRDMSKTRSLWTGGTAATSQDLSALFVVRCIELYLRPGGKFGYVMPLAVRTRAQYQGFRAGTYPTAVETVGVAFDRQWDLHLVKPKFFPQSVGVVIGQRVADASGIRPLPDVAEVWAGTFETRSASLEEVAVHISRTDGEVLVSQVISPYFARFTQGATVVPRFLFLVDEQPAAPLGTGSGRTSVRSRRSPLEKDPWKFAPSLDGAVEQQFIRQLCLGESLLPYRLIELRSAVIPLRDGALLPEDEIDQYQGLSRWWLKAEAAWKKGRSRASMELSERLDYHHGLSKQTRDEPYKVVYAKSGAYLAAALVYDASVVIDHKLYWAPMSSLDEANFLLGILNSNALTQLVRPYQALGEHNPRDFDKNVLRLSIPEYDSGNHAHQRLASLAAQAASVAASTALPQRRFELKRRAVREALVAEGISQEIDGVVKSLLL